MRRVFNSLQQVAYSASVTCVPKNGWGAATIACRSLHTTDLAIPRMPLELAAKSTHGMWTTASCGLVRRGQAGKLSWTSLVEVQTSVMARTLTSTASQHSATAKEASSEKQLSAANEEYDAITDKIPEKPITVVEGASYGMFILAGLGIAAACAYGVLSELLFDPKEFVVFNKALERIQIDPRVNVRLGEPLRGYGSESNSRSARQHIKHREYYGPDGLYHLAVLFYVKGPHGTATVHADMFKDESNQYQWQYLYLDFPSGSRVIVESPP